MALRATTAWRPTIETVTDITTLGLVAAFTAMIWLETEVVEVAAAIEVVEMKDGGTVGEAPSDLEDFESKLKFR
jgi:hypothetical protein